MINLFDSIGSGSIGSDPTEKEAIDYFEEVRWGGTPACVRCGKSDKVTAQKKHDDYWCGRCRSFFNVFTNTPLERSKIDARKWLYTSYLLMTSRKGISATQLSEKLSVSYPTAWYMLHRLRAGCGEKQETFDREAGVDEIYIGGKERNKHEDKQLNAGRGAASKTTTLSIRKHKDIWAAIRRGCKGVYHNWSGKVLSGAAIRREQTQ